MFPVMSSAHKLNGYLFCLMLAGMLLYSLPAVVSFSKSQTDAFSLFMDGKLLRKFEQRYDKDIFLRDPSVRLWANIQYQVFGEGRPGVVLGKDGWLYTNQEYLIPNDLDANLNSQLARIAKVQKLLQEHGKQLVLLPVPMKLDIYAEHASAPVDPRALGLYERFVSELGQRQIDTAAVQQAFRRQRGDSELFVRTDTHWSPAGARLAAQELARQYPQLRGEQPYASRQAGEKALKGDLLNYVQFTPELAPQLFKPVTVALYETTNDTQSVDEDSLFGEQQQSIALVGSSYSKIDDWNFVGFLKEALQNDLVSMAVEARGPFQAMDDFTRSDLLNNPHIQTVIWEFPLRTVLAQRDGTKSWQSAQHQSF